MKIAWREICFENNPSHATRGTDINTFPRCVYTHLQYFYAFIGDETRLRILGSTVKRLSAARGDSKERPRKSAWTRVSSKPSDSPREAIPSVPFRRPPRTECDEYFRDRSISSDSASSAGRRRREGRIGEGPCKESDGK